MVRMGDSGIVGTVDVRERARLPPRRVRSAFSLICALAQSPGPIRPSRSKSSRKSARLRPSSRRLAKRLPAAALFVVAAGCPRLVVDATGSAAGGVLIDPVSGAAVPAGAQTFSTEKRITSIAGPSINPAIAAVGSNVYLVWSENFNNGPGGAYQGDIMFSRSTDNGAVVNRSRIVS